MGEGGRRKITVNTVGDLPDILLLRLCAPKGSKSLLLSWFSRPLVLGAPGWLKVITGLNFSQGSYNMGPPNACRFFTEIWYVHLEAFQD